MNNYRAAGEPAARLISQAIADAVSLDKQRQQLAADNPELEELLFDIETEALLQLHGQVQARLAAMEAAGQAPPSARTAGVVKRLGNPVGRLVRGRHVKDRVRPDAAPAPDGTSGSDEHPSGSNAEGGEVE